MNNCTDMITVIHDSQIKEYTKSTVILTKDTTIEAKIGENFEHYLEIYSKLYEVQVKYENYNDELNPDELIVVDTCQNKLGTISFKYSDDLFTKAIIDNTDQKLCYNGDIPDNWSENASTYVHSILEDMTEITINGNVGESSLKDIYFDCGGYNNLKITINGSFTAYAIGSKGIIESLTIIGDIIGDNILTIPT